MVAEEGGKSMPASSPISGGGRHCEYTVGSWRRQTIESLSKAQSLTQFDVRVANNPSIIFRIFGDQIGNLRCGHRCDWLKGELL